MRYCPNCHAEIEDEYCEYCPQCGAKLTSVSIEDDEELSTMGFISYGEEPVAVYSAPDELSARMIESLLEKEGIECVVRSNQISMYDSIAMMMEPFWGDVLVAPSDYDRAKMIIEEYLESFKEEEEE